MEALYNDIEVSQLRRQAEDIVDEQPLDLQNLSAEDLKTFVYNLQVEKTFLELENKQLKVICNDAVEHLAERQMVDQSIQQQSYQLELLNRAIESFVSSLDLGQILTAVLEEVRRMLGVAGYSVWLVDTDTDELVCWQVPDNQTDVVLGWRLLSNQGVANWVARNGQSVIVPDTRKDPRHFKEIDRRLEQENRSILSVPIKGKDNTLGAIQVVDTEINRFADVDRQLLETLAAAAAIAIENAHLYEQARQDAETKSTLLREVNHRVKNNLAVIRSMLYLKQSRVDVADLEIYQSLTQDLVSQVQGLAVVHDMLSDTNWLPLELSELTTRIIDSTLQVLVSDQFVSVSVTPSAVQITPDQAHDLTLILNELVTNTVKYALLKMSGILQIEVDIGTQDNNIYLQFKDNGPGYPPGALEEVEERRNSGLRLVQSIIRTGLKGTLLMENNDGAVSTIQFRAGMGQ